MLLAYLLPGFTHSFDSPDCFKIGVCTHVTLIFIMVIRMSKTIKKMRLRMIPMLTMKSNFNSSSEPKPSQSNTFSLYLNKNYS